MKLDIKTCPYCKSILNKNNKVAAYCPVCGNGPTAGIIAVSSDDFDLLEESGKPVLLTVMPDATPESRQEAIAAIQDALFLYNDDRFVTFEISTCRDKTREFGEEANIEEENN